MISDPTKLPFSAQQGTIDEKCFAASGLKFRSTVRSGAEGLNVEGEDLGKSTV